MSYVYRKVCFTVTSAKVDKKTLMSIRSILILWRNDDNNNLSYLSSNDLKTRVMPKEMVLCLFLIK